jgi:hypothetical protein
VAHKLLFSEWVLAFAQPCEVVIADRALQAPLLGKPALPRAEALLVAAPVILPLRCEFPRVVRSRLASGERFGGHGQHGGILALLTTRRLVGTHG